MTPPADIDLKTHQVDIWRARLNPSDNSLRSIKQTLSTDEAERAARFHFPADRERFIAAHGCLRAILRRYLGCESDQITFSVNQYGKPALNHFRLEFNLSHSGDFALIGVTQARKIGVDVEKIRPEIELESIAQHNFSKREVAELMSLQPDQRVAGFFLCWTRKEAYIKAHGMGLSLLLDSFDVSLRPNEPAILRATRPDAQEAAHWRLLALEVNPNYKAAAVVETYPGMEVRLWDWKI